MLFFSHLERRGIELGETTIVIEACTIRGKRFGIFLLCILTKSIEELIPLFIEE